MLPQYRSEKFSLTAIKAKRMLTEYDTHIAMEDSEIMLELLQKLSKLSVSDMLKQAALIKKKPVKHGIVFKLLDFGEKALFTT